MQELISKAKDVAAFSKVILVNASPTLNDQGAEGHQGHQDHRGY